MSDLDTSQAHARERGDARMEAAMGRLLQIGVLLASVTVLVGGALYLRENSGQIVSYRNFHGAEAHSWLPRRHDLSRGEAGAILQLGILLLIATPVARVILALVAFALERDRLYTAISLAVLLILVAGLLGLA